jgi:outer membrane protein
MLKSNRRLVAKVAMIAATWWAAPPPVHAQQQTQTLTLAQAVSEALVRNDRIANQHDSVEQAALAVQLARNIFQPKLVPNVLGSFGQTNVANQTYRLDLNQRFATGTEVRAGLGASTAQIPALPGSTTGDIRFYNSDTTFTLTQPLLKGFGPAVARRPLTSAELRQADAARQQTLSEQQITVEVVAAYYRVVGQQALVGVAGKSLERSRKLLEASQAKLEAGLVSQLDVYRAQQLVSQGEIQFSDAEAAVDDALDQLRLLVGRDADAPLTVVGDIPNTAARSVSVDAAIAQALDSRPDLQSARAAMADADRAISYSRNQRLPQVDVNLALTRRETADSLSDSFRFNNFQFATFFAISMPVDRTPQIVDYQNALIERDRRQREMETLRKRITADVRRAVRDTDRMARNLTVSDASLEISRKEVEVAQFRYERGLSNNLDVVTAEAGLLTAESRKIAAQAELAVARLNLRATLGVLDPRKDVTENPDARRGDAAGHD